MTEIACIVPATRTSLLDSVLESISRQTRPVAEVIVVLDGGDLEWQSKREDVKILRNARNLGKVKSTLKALSSTKSELILSVDCDTIVAPNSVECMAEGLKGDIEVVCARIEPLERSTWIGKTRSDLYRKWHARPKLINGACFLARRETFEEHYPTLRTMVEDQELTRILSKPSKRWTVCREAVARTEEPRNFRGLFHQLIRWAYGSQHLRSMKERGYKAALGMMLFLFVYIDILGSKSAIFSLDGPLLAESLFGPAFMITALTVGLTSRYYVRGSSLVRLLSYSVIEAVAFVVAGTRFIFGRAPPW